MLTCFLDFYLSCVLICKRGISVSNIINLNDPILVTGAAGFVGTRVVGNLLDRGFQNIRCLVRETSSTSRLREVIDSRSSTQ
ncbi:SDR family oxidoreductase, partial [Candidatus Bathyarchaeota archaeon]|nr:SDR family oxidoreductase [Candidatus Bathyarchaeota archaeon]